MPANRHPATRLDEEWELSTWLSHHGTIYAAPTFDDDRFDRYYEGTINRTKAPTYLVHFPQTDTVGALFTVDATNPNRMASIFSADGKLLSYLLSLSNAHIPTPDHVANRSPDFAAALTQYSQFGHLHQTPAYTDQHGRHYQNAPAQFDFHTAEAVARLNRNYRYIEHYKDDYGLADLDDLTTPDTAGVIIADTNSDTEPVRTLKPPQVVSTDITSNDQTVTWQPL